MSFFIFPVAEVDMATVPMPAALVVVVAVVAVPASVSLCTWLLCPSS